MHLFFFVEEQSMEMVLQQLIPNMIPESVSYQIITFEGKPDLLKNVQSRLTAYARWVPKDYYFVVLVDKDNDECQKLKAILETKSQNSGLKTKSSVIIDENFNIINRIAIEELESWFFGDPDALKTAFPKLSATFEKGEKYRHPEQISGGTWEALEHLLQRKGYFETGLSKLTLALTVAPCMTPENNRAHSFQVFHSGLLDLINQ